MSNSTLQGQSQSNAEMWEILQKNNQFLQTKNDNKKEWEGREEPLQIEKFKEHSNQLNV